MEFKGTKGKWYCYRKTDQHKIEYVITESQEIICDLPHFCNNNSDANAKLISCAPEMLEMLEKIVDAQFNPKKSLANLNSEISKAEQLIKKATEI